MCIFCELWNTIFEMLNVTSCKIKHVKCGRLTLIYLICDQLNVTFKMWDTKCNMWNGTFDKPFFLLFLLFSNLSSICHNSSVTHHYFLRLLHLVLIEEKKNCCSWQFCFKFNWRIILVSQDKDIKSPVMHMNDDGRRFCQSPHNPCMIFCFPNFWFKTNIQGLDARAPECSL